MGKTVTEIVHVSPEADALEFAEFDEPYGWELQLDLYGCNPELTGSATTLGHFTAMLIKKIGMEKYGPFRCEHFGHTSAKTAGLSFQQWIETSQISGHEANGKLYLNVFSCQLFDPEVVVALAVDFFTADAFVKHWRVRY